MFDMLRQNRKSARFQTNLMNETNLLMQCGAYLMAFIVVADKWLEWLSLCIASSSTTPGKLGCRPSSLFSLEILCMVSVAIVSVLGDQCSGTYLMILVVAGD